MTDVDVLLIGGGVASAAAAAALRDAGFDGRVLLAGRELDPPYHRPPLSKELLQGRTGKEDLLVHPPGWWEAGGVELRTRTNVLTLDPAARTATLQGGEVVGFRHALVATGSMVRRIPLDGADLDGLHWLRAPGNAASIRRDAETAEQAVCIGGSYIGCEVAASLRALGADVSVVMQEHEPYERGFGRHVGRWVRRLLEAHGIRFVAGTEVRGLAGEGRVERVVLTDGGELPAQLVVCGTGAVPDVMLARRSGLSLGPLGGVACDASLRTSAEGVWAAGDVCEYESVLHGRAVRVEHEAVAEAQGAHAARGMLGDETAFTEVPYFWSDLADWATLEHLGPALDADAEEVEGGEDAFTVRHLRGGRLVGVTSVNGHADLDAARAELRAAAAP